MFVGALLEGEVVVMTASALAHKHVLVLWQVLVAAFSATFLADFSYFILGRKFSQTHYVRKIISQPKFKKVHARLDSGSGLYAVAFRFMPGFRIVGPIALAQTSIRTGVYAIVCALTALVWTLFYGLIGRWATHQLGHLSHREILILAAGGLMVVAGYHLIARLRQKRLLRDG